MAIINSFTCSGNPVLNAAIVKDTRNDVCYGGVVLPNKRFITASSVAVTKENPVYKIFLNDLPDIFHIESIESRTHAIFITVSSFRY